MLMAISTYLWTAQQIFGFGHIFLIDLNGWKEKSTKDFIFQDSLLPLYAKLQQVYKNGDMVILCTARELGKWDYEYIHFYNIYYDRIISRPKGNTTKDHILKKAQCRYLFNLPCYRDMEKWFFDDNEANLEALADLGAIVSNARQWNKIAQRGLENALEGK